jgi:hypothetical protein
VSLPDSFGQSSDNAFLKIRNYTAVIPAKLVPAKAGSGNPDIDQPHSYNSGCRPSPCFGQNGRKADISGSPG